MQWFLDLSTRGKLVAAFGSMIVMLMVVGGTAYRSLEAIKETQRDLYNREIADELAIKEVRLHQTAIRADVGVMFLLSDRAQQEALHADVKKRSARVDELMGRLMAGGMDSPRTQRLREFDDLRKEYRDTRETVVIPLIVAGKADEARKSFVTAQGDRNARMQKLADDLAEQSEASVAAAMERSDALARASVTVFLVSGAIAVILAMLLTVLFNRILADPLRRLSEAARQIADGDLTVALPDANRKDETGTLVQSFRHMVARLRDLMREITEGVNVVASSAAEITASTTQVASGSAETAAAVSQTTATVEEIKQTTQVATEKARYVSETAQKTAQVSEDGRRSTAEAIEAMNRIQGQMESIAESIVRLSEQGQAIGEIIATVNDLAEQSNLLAVNAAIEAAKAGEHGRGFGVVAQEVKSLAEQSKQATAQVRSILGQIQKATSGAVLATEKGSQSVEAGVKLFGDVEQSIERLSGSISESAQAAMQISASAQQQLVGMDQVALAMQNINQASTQNVAGTRQAEAAAQSLHGLGQKLKSLVEQYRA